jgi:hypothetical protein
MTVGMPGSPWMGRLLIASLLLYATPLWGQVETASSGDWALRSRLTPVDDSMIDMALSEAQEALGGDGIGLLAFSCFPNGDAVVFYETDLYLLGDETDQVRARYRVDGGRPRAWSGWSVGTLGGPNAYADDASVVRQMYADFRRGSSVVMELVDDASGKVVRHRFSLRGFTAVSGRLACAPGE